MDFPNYEVAGPISSGANATVYKARHRYLNRLAAIKIYDRKKPTDTRDKILQGILESQKVAQAKSEQVIRVYDAGVMNQKYFIIMEHFEGSTLRTWLSDCKPNMAIRAHLCRHIVFQIFQLAADDLLHGDFHEDNV